ncbi:MAG: M23 family metallopeptidase, partial [Parasphingorhabdus sp.]
KGGGKVNDGLNIGVPKGTPIRASADGVIAYSGDEIGVFGGLILINHGSGWVTAYGHADTLNVTRGQKVKVGQVIGLAGDSGYVQEPQLHFEIRKNRKPVNPKIHLPKRS